MGGARERGRVCFLHTAFEKLVRHFTGGRESEGMPAETRHRYSCVKKGNREWGQRGDTDAQGVSLGRKHLGNEEWYHFFTVQSSCFYIHKKFRFLRIQKVP